MQNAKDSVISLVLVSVKKLWRPTMSIPWVFISSLPLKLPWKQKAMSRGSQQSCVELESNWAYWILTAEYCSSACGESRRRETQGEVLDCWVTSVECTPICLFEWKDWEQHNLCRKQDVLIPLPSFITTGALILSHVLAWHQFCTEWYNVIHSGNTSCK